MQKTILPLISGFLAALFFYEPTLALLHAAGLIENNGFSTLPFPLLGMPAFIAHALGSALWAVLMCWLLRISPDRAFPWGQAFAFGGIVLTAGSIFVVGPLCGNWPSGNMLPPLAIGFAANAIWGWGALVFLRSLMGQPAIEADEPPAKSHNRPEGLRQRIR